MKEKVNLLWTGGLDSTCRLIELSQLDVEVQPYYIVDKTRKSVPNEKKAMNTILSKLRQRENVIAKLNDVIYINDIENNASITNSWNNLYSTYKVGSQYDFIARFAKQYDLQLEVGIEKVVYSRAVKAIETDGELKEYNSKSGINEYFVLEQSSSDDINNIFGNLRFPTSLWNMTKLEEVEEMKSSGFEDFINDTWFCHDPVLGLPCGHCNPCKDVISEGMKYRIPLRGYILGATRKIARKFKSLFSKLTHLK